MRRLGFAYGLCSRISKVFALNVAIFVAATASAEDKPIVVAFGDSLTHGYGLRGDQGFVPQLGSWLSAQGQSVDLVNAGVSGDTTAGGAARIDWTLTDDVDAIIVELGGNDLLRGIDPAVSRANLERILEAAKARDVEIMLVGLTATRNNGPEFKAAFDAMYPELAQAYDAVYARDFFMGFLEPDGTVDRDKVRSLMQGDQIHPNADGVKLIVDALGPIVIELIERVEAKG